jgi:hypothetical protein
MEAQADDMAYEEVRMGRGCAAMGVSLAVLACREGSLSGVQPFSVVHGYVMMQVSK